MNYYYDDDDDGVVESSNPRAGLLFLAGIVGFFVFLALAVPAIKANGGSTDSLFFAVIGAVAGAIFLPLVLNFLLIKLNLKGKSRRELLESFVGYTPTYFDEQETMMVDAELATLFYAALPAPSSVSQDGYDDDYEEEFIEGDAVQSSAIIEENPMLIAPDYQPNIDFFLSNKVTVIGITGSGKSNAVAVLVEELGAYVVPLLLADTEDEYSPLAAHKYLPRGMCAGSADLLCVNPLLKDFIAVDADGAFEFGQMILEDGLQVVLNLKSYPYEEAAAVMINIIRGMNAWEDARANKDQVSCMFVLDEAHKWLPQRSDESELSKETLQALQVAIFDTLVRRGRKRGLGLVLASQKVTEIDKRALQSQWRFLFRQTESRDLAYYRSLGVDIDEVPTLGNGECYVFSPTLQGWPVAMRERYSPHGANTPGLASVLKHRERLRPLSAVITRSFVGTMHDPDTDALPVPTMPEQRPTFVIPQKVEKQIDLELYAEAWNAGANSVRKLQAAFEGRLTNYQATSIRKLMLEAGLIEE